MPRYFFHYRSGTDLILDHDGRLLEDEAALIAAALIEAREQASADALGGHVDMQSGIWVEDAAGVEVHSITLRDAVRISNG